PRRVREAVAAFTRPARLDQEDGGAGVLHQAARDHATRRTRADDDVVVTPGERLAVFGIAMNRTHGRSLPKVLTWASDPQPLPSGRAKTGTGSCEAGLLERQVRGGQPGADPGQGHGRAPAADPQAVLVTATNGYFAVLMMVVWVNSPSPSEPISTPTPDCFAPPNGMSGRMSRCWLTQTVPASIRAATANARSRSADQTEPPRPYSVSLTRAIASSRSE